MPEPETEHGLRIQLTAALVDCHALRTKLATALRERDEAVAEADKQRARRNLCQTDRNAYELQNEDLRKALAAANARANHAETNLVTVREMLATHVEEKLAANARADAMEANALAVAQERLEERASRERNWDEMKEALAAARRECDGLRDFLRECASELQIADDEGCAWERVWDVRDRMKIRAAALSAPAAAAGEDSK